MKLRGKKLTILVPLLMVAGTVVVSILATGTNVMAQSFYRSKTSLTIQNQEVSEKIDASSSLTRTNSLIPSLGFVPANVLNLKGTLPALSMR